MLFTLLYLIFGSAKAEGIDEVYIRPGNGWGTDIFGKIFNNSQFGKSYAIVIGVGKYESFPSLDAPVHDAIKFSEFLKGEANFDYVVTLTDEKATQTRIETLMEEGLPNKIQPGDRVLIYFSGHGATRQLPNHNKRGYLILSNSGTSAWNTMVDMPRLMEWAQNFDGARHVLFVIDACFSGLAAYQVKAVNVAEQTIERLSQPGHHIVTAGVEDEESYAFNGESIFTSEFLAAARGQLGAPPDGIISLSEIMLNVGRAIDLRRAELGERIKMSPHMYQTRLEDQSGEFFFLTKPRSIIPTIVTPITPGGAIKDAEPNISVKRGSSETDNSGSAGSPDQSVWESVSSSRDPEKIQAFISSFPTSILRPKAEELLRDLKVARLPSTDSSAPTSPSLSSVPTPAPFSPQPSPPVETNVPPPDSKKPEPKPITPAKGVTPSVPYNTTARAVPSPHLGKASAPKRAGDCFTFNGERFCN